MKNIFFILALGLILRLSFVHLPPFETDMNSFIAWASQMAKTGPLGFYTSGIWSDYAPGYLYFLWIVGGIQNLMPNADRFTLEMIHKSIPLIFDIGSSILIYLMVRRFTESERIALICSLLYVCNPILILTGVVWAQVDTVYVFFVLLSWYLVLLKEHYSGYMLYVMAFVIKPQAIALAPLYFLYFFFRLDIRQRIYTTLLSVFTFYILTMPFFGINALNEFRNRMNASYATYPYGSVNAFNFWGIYGFFKRDSEPFIGSITQQQLGYGMYFSVLVLTFLLGIRIFHKDNAHSFYSHTFLLASFLIVVPNMLLTRMHERYIFPFFAFFTVFLGLYVWQHKKSYRDILWGNAGFLLVIISFLHLVNLYYVYTLYRYWNVGVPVDNKLFFMIERVFEYGSTNPQNMLPFWSYLAVFWFVGFFLYTYYHLRNRS